MDDQQFINEQQFLTPKDVLGYAEEYITCGNAQHLFNFSLSNNLDDIEIAIHARTGLNIYLENAYWQIDPDICIDIKHLMNKHRVIYSMATWYEEKTKIRFILVNMRVGDKWYLTRYNEVNGEIYNHEKKLIRNETIEELRKTIEEIAHNFGIDLNESSEDE